MRPFDNDGIPRPWLQALLAVAVLGLVIWAYAPGLQGGFLFDDEINLNALGDQGRIDNAAAFWRYITSGSADRTGRPISLLTFLLDANHWPAEPYPFKRSNLFLHVLNALLLGAALYRIGIARTLPSPRAAYAALTAAGLWALHPLFVSTTMYVVQRQAMLPATFVFLSITAWLWARERLLRSNRGSFVALLGAVVVIGTSLAMLSKANGILLPVFLLAVELCLPPPQGTGARRFRYGLFVFLGIPAVLLGAALLLAIPDSAHTALTDRTWTLGQRLLTEPRVLWDYLRLLWLPRAITPGLFNDSFAVSTSALQPWTTLPALIGIALLTALALRERQRHAALALAWLFFIGGHLIESGPLPLEIYFEHRNYLPAAMMFWPLALWLATPSSTRALRVVLALALCVGLAGLTRINASLWGDTNAQAVIWADKNPHSPRAQAYAAQVELDLGRAQASEARLRRALEEHPGETQLAINLVGTRCSVGEVSAADLAMVRRVFREDADPTRLGITWLQDAVSIAYDHSCKGLDAAALRDLAAAFAENPRTAQVAGRRRDLAQFEGAVALREKDPARAHAAFLRAYAADPRAEMIILQSAQLASAGAYALALENLALARTTAPKPWYAWRSMGDVHDWIVDRQGYWNGQIQELRGKIQADLDAERERATP